VLELGAGSTEQGVQFENAGENDSSAVLEGELRLASVSASSGGAEANIMLFADESTLGKGPARHSSPAVATLQGRHAERVDAVFVAWSTRLGEEAQREWIDSEIGSEAEDLVREDGACETLDRMFAATDNGWYRELPAAG
jgi:hypothetical protein